MAWTKTGNLRGPSGLNGVDGLAGPAGPAGPAGLAGSPGATGPAGPAGAVGPAGLTWRATWAAGTAYVLDDAVYYDGSSYFATSSSTGSRPDLDDGSHWQPLAVRGATGPIGPAGTAGLPGATGPAGAAGTAGAAGPAGPQGIQGIQGLKGDTGAAGSGFNYRGPWMANTAYVPNDVVSYNGSSYVSTTSFTSGSTFNPANWTVMAGVTPQTFYGLKVDPLTADLVMTTIAPDSGEVIHFDQYDDFFFAPAGASVAWDTTNPSRLIVNADFPNYQWVDDQIRAGIQTIADASVASATAGANAAAASAATAAANTSTAPIRTIAFMLGS